jgi:hypothetical protein
MVTGPMIAAGGRPVERFPGPATVGVRGWLAIRRGR